MPSKFEFGYESDDSYYIRHMTDGTTTFVQIVYRDPYGIAGGQQVIGAGTARRRKGDKRNPGLGSALAFMRAHAMAYEYYKNAAENCEHGTTAQQMDKRFERVIAQDRKAKAKAAKDERRMEARKRWAKLNPLGRRNV